MPPVRAGCRWSWPQTRAPPTIKRPSPGRIAGIRPTRVIRYHSARAAWHSGAPRRRSLVPQWWDSLPPPFSGVNLRCLFCKCIPAPSVPAAPLRSPDLHGSIASSAHWSCRGQASALRIRGIRPSPRRRHNDRARTTRGGRTSLRRDFDRRHDVPCKPRPSPCSWTGTRSSCRSRRWPRPRQGECWSRGPRQARGSQSRDVP